MEKLLIGLLIGVLITSLANMNRLNLLEKPQRTGVIIKVYKDTRPTPASTQKKREFDDSITFED